MSDGTGAYAGALTHRPWRADGGRESSQDVGKRHRILRSLRDELERYPCVVHARGVPEGRYAEIEAELEPTYFGRESTQASLRVTWQPNPRFPPGVSLDDRVRTDLTSNFTIHYHESSGFECGVHLEANPHVEGHLHYQERASSDNAYTYEEVRLDARSPVGVLWEVLETISDRLESH